MVRRWLLLFVALFPLVAVWAVTNPMFASPDENSHMVRAQSIANGDFSNPFTTDGLPVESVECFSFQPEVTPACQDLTWGEDGTQRIAATDGYPPLFHGLAAIPAVFTSGLTGAYVMRLWMAVVVVAIAAWAGVFVTRPGSGPWPLTGFLIGFTPMAVFTMGTVNPTGLATASAALFVAAAIALRSNAEDRVAALIGAAAGAAMLALSRRDGIVWLAILVIALLPLVPWRSLREKAAGPSRNVLVAAAGAGAALVGIVAVTGRTTFARFFRNWRDGQGTDAWEAARYVRTYLYQAVGTFGWLDSPIGEEAFLLATIVAGFVVVLGLVSGCRAFVASTGLAVAGLIVAPIGFGMVRFPYLQGRYLVPMWAGVLIIAGASAAHAALPPALSRRAVRLLLVAWLVVQATAAMQNLRRYAVGRSGSWNFVSDAEWNPDTMSNLAAVCCFAAALVIAVFATRHVLANVETDDETVSDFLRESPRHAIEDRPSDRQTRE